MKKRLLVLGLAFTMLAATACGTSSDNGSKTSKADKTVTATSNDNKKAETQNNDDKDAKKEETKESYKSADDITMDDLNNHEETSADDFEYGDGPDGSVVIDGYTGDDPIVVIPDEIDGKKVVDFGKTFLNNQDVVAIKIGNNVEKVCGGAFVNCPSLKYLVSGENVKSFEGGSFSGCFDLEIIELNDGLESYGEKNRQITKAGKGTEVNIPSSVTEISTAIHGYKFKVKAGSYAESFFSQEPDADYTVE